MLVQRGYSDLAIDKIKDLCEIHQLVTLDLMEPLTSSNEPTDQGMTSNTSSRQEEMLSYRRRMFMRQQESSASDMRNMTDEI